MKSADVKESKIRLSLLQIYIGITVILFFLYIFWPHWFDNWSKINFYLIWLSWVGVAMGFLSLVYFIRVHIFLGKYFSYTLKILDDHVLITNGPYRFIRHPMYLAFLILHSAVFLVIGNWFFGIIWIGGLSLVLILRIPKEEEMLIDAFGEDYIEYRDRTGLLWPPIFKLLNKNSRDKIRNALWTFKAMNTGFVVIPLL